MSGGSDALGEGRRDGLWLFSRRLDLIAFLGPVVASLVLVAIGVPLGLVATEATAGAGATDTPEWAWLVCVLAVDVAHVWGNLVLVYADPVERRRRAGLYVGLPLAALVLSVALASEGEIYFWRVLAALAVWHFVRQQIGWVRLYRAKAGEDRRSGAGGLRWGRIIDEGAIYAATLAPIVWWHGHLPRPFAWLVPGDFVAGVPAWLGEVALGIEVVWLIAYVTRAGMGIGRNWQFSRKRQIARAWGGSGGELGAAAESPREESPGAPVSWGKHVIVLSTALLWWLGIVAFASDYVFAVTNVLAHGVPYIVLIAMTARRRVGAGASVPRVFRRGALVIVALLVTLAFLEEGAWDRLVWHERGWLFPLGEVDLEAWRWVVVPLLAWPQMTHYLLDGFIWKRRQNTYLVS